MAHQPGWIQLYTLLEQGGTPDPRLIEQCKSSRTGLGETMLHWYAIEGAPAVLEKLINLGFDVNVVNKFGKSALLECSMIDRWDNALILLNHGAKADEMDEWGDDYLAQLRGMGKVIPETILAALEK